MSVEFRVSLEVVQSAARTPGPGTQHAPIIGLAPLAPVGNSDHAAGQAGAAVGLDAVRFDQRHRPASGDELLQRRRIAVDIERGGGGRRAIGCQAGCAWNTASDGSSAASAPSNVIDAGVSGGGRRGKGHRTVLEDDEHGHGQLAAAGFTSIIGMSTCRFGSAELST